MIFVTASSKESSISCSNWLSIFLCTLYSYLSSYPSLSICNFSPVIYWAFALGEVDRTHGERGREMGGERDREQSGENNELVGGHSGTLRLANSSLELCMIRE